MHDLFLSAIAAEPDNPTHRLVLADWLEEQGDPACEIIRWAHAEGKRPLDWLAKASSGPARFSWFGLGDAAEDIDPQSDLPKYLFAHLSAGRLIGGPSCRFRNYNTSSEAWLDFLNAARRTNWKPPAHKTSQPSPTE